MAELVQEVVVDASPETIFGLLTVADEHVQWMGTEAELDPRPGGTYRVLVAGQYPAAGQFVEVVPNDRVVFTFGWDAPGNPVPPGSSTIEISLHPEGAKTRVRLVHRDLPEGVVGEHTHGWGHYLGRLSVAASGGDVGPDAGPGGGAEG
ncbi:MAG TPA: SRPBCC family protein [Acidimicrobiales bacterium]|nr:SRPBCC family protein [Acidimicrobiales bacterium]